MIEYVVYINLIKPPVVSSYLRLVSDEETFILNKDEMSEIKKKKRSENFRMPHVFFLM